LGEVILDPQPSRAVTALLLLAVMVGSLTAGFFMVWARRRWAGVLLGTTAIGTSLLNLSDRLRSRATTCASPAT
jgi:hypothetical protein